MDHELRARVEANLFPASRGAVEPWNSFPWHPTASKCDTYREHSSQALAIDVFGTIRQISDRDSILGTLAAKIGLPVEGPWSVDLEWQDPENLLREPRQPTQVDAVAQSKRALMLFECKFTEVSGGICSQTRPLQSGPNRGVVQCNGNYEMQTNKLTSVPARCALTRKRIRYWEVIPQVFDIATERDIRPCPFAGSHYQWMRNITLCHELARKSLRRGAFVLVHVDDPAFPIAKAVKLPEWQQLQASVKEGSVVFANLSVQKVVEIACSSASSSLPLLLELKAWIRNKVDRVSSELHPPREASSPLSAENV